MKIRGAVLRTVGADRPYGKSEPIDVCEVDLAPPAASELLVRIEAASVCHSDLSVVNGSRPRPVPMLLGHEAAGTVVATGPGVADVSPGQRVILTFLPRCGKCKGCLTDGKAPCVSGSAANGAGEMLSGGSRLSISGESVRHHLGVSAFATHAVVDRRSVVPVENDVPPSVAAVLGCAVLTGGGAVTNAVKPQSGMSIAVIGLGGVGMAALLTAVSFAGVQVFAVDSSSAKRDQAAAFGAHGVYSPEEAARELRADAVVEAVGRSVAFELAVACTAPGGTMVTVGLPAPSDLASISPLVLVGEGKTIIGSYLGSSVPERDLPLLVDLWRRGRLPVDHLISSTIRLSDINDAMERLAAGTELRQIIDLTEEDL